MIRSLLKFSVAHPWLVVIATGAAVAIALRTAAEIPLDAIPDLSDTQVVVQAEWMGQSADLVDEQVAWPLTTALLGTAGARTVRSSAMPGMAFVHCVFDDGVDLAVANARVRQALALVQGRLPAGAKLEVGPEASGVGWSMQYALVADDGSQDLMDLRLLNDVAVRPALAALEGVAEVAALGGAAVALQVDADPDALTRHGVSLSELAATLRASGATVGGGGLEVAEAEHSVRLAAPVTSVTAVEETAVRALPGGRILRIRDVADVHFGPTARRGVTDLDGRGETIGGIVVARHGVDTLDVVERAKARLRSLESNLPPGIGLVVTYDRSTLIWASIATLRRALSEELLTIAIVIFVFLLHLRSALVPVLVLPAAVALAALPMAALGLGSNILSLAGIALALGDLVDATVVLVDDAHKRLEPLPPNAKESQRIDALRTACLHVGPPVFTSLLMLLVSFLPVFALQGQASRLFAPLAATKSLAMAAAAVLSLTLAPALLVLLVRGKIRREQDHPLSRVLIAGYTPLLRIALWNPKTTLLIAVLAVASAIPLAQRLGSEFMPMLDEGDLLAMPTTLPGISPSEAQRTLILQDQVLRTFPEVERVHGKAGRAETATDPAPLSMIETVIKLRPRSEWRRVADPRFWHAEGAGPALAPAAWVPDIAVPLLERFWPSTRPWTTTELIAAMQQAAVMPGFTQAWTMPIRTRIDMLATGIRTPVGVKVFSEDQAVVDEVGRALAAALSTLPGTRSATFEGSEAPESLDIALRSEALARHGLRPGDVGELLQLASGAMPVTEATGRGVRLPLELRVQREARGDLESIAALPLASRRPVPRQTRGDANGSGVPASAMEPMATGGAGMAMATSAETASPGPAAALTGGAPPAALTPLRLGDVADLSWRPAPAMVQREGGRRVGIVYVDIDQDKIDLGGWIAAARGHVKQQGLDRKADLVWDGQYAQLEAVEERMRVAIPLTILLMFGLLFMQFRNAAQPALVLCTVPFALVGAVWQLHVLGFHVSTATAVGAIALCGVAAETGVVMLVYLDERVALFQAEGRLRDLDDLRQAVLEGAALRLRPKLMTVGMNLFGLLPLMVATGAGADVTRRIVAPMIGGILASTFLTLEVLPVLYVAWQRRRLKLAPRPTGTVDSAPMATPGAA